METPHKLKLKFTEGERAALTRRFQEYLAMARAIAEIHGLPADGNLRIAPDNSGFMADDND